MNIKFISKTLFVVLLVSIFLSCDKDLNQIGADILNDNNHFGMSSDSTTTVAAYNQRTGAVQTNNLPLNSLGVYDNQVFGTTSASFVTQLSLGTIPTFVDQNTITTTNDSVYLYIPFFTKNAVTDANSNTTYELDSILGKNNKIKLSVFRSNFYMNDFDPLTAFQNQRYFSDQNSLFLSNLNSYGRLNNQTNNVGGTTIDNSQNDNFSFSASEIKLFDAGPTTPVLKQRLSPGIFLLLDKAYFETNILKTSPSNLMNNNVFREYFRGLYFKVEPNSATPKGSMARLNFSRGKIVISYHEKKSATETAIVRKTLELNMTGNSANLFDNVENPTYNSATSNPNKDIGDQKLFVKGGQGSVAVVSLFNGEKNSLSSELNAIRSKGWLINDAYLTFNVDQASMTPFGTPAASQEVEPNRLYLYDLNNKRPIVDYVNDPTSASNPKFIKIVHGGIADKNAISKRTISYKIRITDHLRNLVTKDSTNVKLAIGVTETIQLAPVASLKDPFQYFSSLFGSTQKNSFTVPVASVINPLGTVLWGTNNVPDIKKKLKLVIWYTKPN